MIPPGTARARSTVPSSRSALRYWTSSSMPRATNIPTTPGRANVPRRQAGAEIPVLQQDEGDERHDGPQQVADEVRRR